MAQPKGIVGILFMMFLLPMTKLINNEEVRNNAGKEFIAMFLENRRNGIPMQLSMTTVSKQTVQVRVQTPIWNSSDSIDITVNVEPDKIKLVEIPDQIRMTGSTKGDKSVLVTSDDNIVLFATNLQHSTGDSCVIYPVECLQKEYVAISFPHETSKRSIFGCVATHDDTNIVISVPRNATLKYEFHSYEYSEEIRINVNQYENFQIEGTDVTGSVITSNKIIACFSGAIYLTVSCNSLEGGSDHMVEQLVPVSSWSFSYMLVSNPNYRIGAGDIVRIVIFYDNTYLNIKFSNSRICTRYRRNKGMFVELFLDPGEAAFIEANKPVLVGQISCSGGIDDDSGDTRLLIPLSVEHFLPIYTFVTPAVNLTTNHVYGIIIITETIIKHYVTLDDVIVSKTIIWKDIKNMGYSYGDLPLEVGVHKLQSLINGNFGGYIYGYLRNEEFATVIGRDLTPVGLRKVKENVYANKQYEFDKVTTPKKYPFKDEKRKASFKRKTSNSVPEVREMLRLNTASIITCLVSCIDYSNCVVLAYSETENHACLLYGYNAICSKFLYSKGYEVYTKD